MAKKFVALGVKGGKARPVAEGEGARSMMAVRGEEQAKDAKAKNGKRAGKLTHGQRLYPHLD